MGYKIIDKDTPVFRADSNNGVDDDFCIFLWGDGMKVAHPLVVMRESLSTLVVIFKPEVDLNCCYIYIHI